MKKIALVTCILMAVTLSACSTNNNNQPNVGTAQGTSKSGSNTTTAQYKDGTFSALGDKWAYGQESADVKIKNGKIIYINLRRLTKDGKEVDYKEWIGKKDAAGKVKPNLRKFRVDMAKRMLARQTYMVDTISSATVSTGNWKIAVQRALDKAKQ